jgi:pimeloyl-ACP methyl ester carboxylesterase
MIVLLHGVPETADIWAKVRPLLGAESVALRLPGFGCARPEGFGATKDEYVQWALDELDRIDGPVDLVGHDWGAALTYRIATAHGGRLHSWAADIANAVHPEYVWHQFAQIWQGPDGEAFFEEQSTRSLEELAAGYEFLGLDHADALTLAGWGDETMARCILDLYRSATPNPRAHWSDVWGPTSAPGLVMVPTLDPFASEAQSREVATSLGARVVTLEGAGHFWPLSAPEAGARALVDFLATTY